MVKAKKVRCICARCSKVKYHSASSIDFGDAVFLCPSCDDLYISWKNKPGRENVYIEAFLKASPKR